MVVKYSEHYKEQAFWVWYNAGKCSAAKLTLQLHDFEGQVPNSQTIGKWMTDWRERADDLDQQAKDKFAQEVIETKVDMLRRHAKLGKDLQTIAWEWIVKHKDELTAASVVRLIKDGYEMERVSVGVPEALEKMLAVSDDELIKQIEDAIIGEDLDILNADK